jgi:tRNA modification GTPase
MHDTIACISTALGIGAISIVRVSGEDSINIVNSIFKGKDLNKVESHTINYGHIIDNDKIIDEVLVSIMKAPNTYTREDIVEINCHGGIAVTNKVLELLVVKGARLALPGEFTKRAFLNGRIDLVEAEAVMDVIDSKTDKALNVAVSNLSGNLSNIIREFRDNLLNLLANIEVNIDYPEYEDAEVVTVNSIKEKVDEMTNSLNLIVKESMNKKIIKEGIDVAIIGKPNVGKSSILNMLLGENKAIVTDIAGTTRDVVEGSISLNGIMLNFIDTAGIRETEDVVEKFGVEKSLEKMNESNLVLFVFNNNEEITKEEEQLLDKIKEKKYIIVVNKKDLDTKLDLSKYDLDNIIYTDTVTDDGVETLKNKIVELFNIDELDNQSDNFFTNERQITLAKEALNILEDVKKGIDNEVPVDMIEIDIKRIWTKLGEILGENYDEELIDKLFSNFCLGK